MAKETWTLTIPGLPVNLNQIRHATWQQPRAMKQEKTELAQGLALQQGRHPSMPWDNVALTATFGIKGARHRDLDNLSLKGFIDGIVHAGILTSDTMQVIKRISVGWEKSDEFYTRITIEPSDD